MRFILEVMPKNNPHNAGRGVSRPGMDRSGQRRKGIPAASYLTLRRVPSHGGGRGGDTYYTRDRGDILIINLGSRH